MPRVLKSRFAIPAGLLVAVGVCGLLTFGTTTAGASSSPVGPSAGSPAEAQLTAATTDFNSGVALPPGIGSPDYLGGRQNTGGANSTARVYKTVNGKKTLVAYGNSAITYTAPPPSYIPAGEALFAQNCASCHGTDAQGSAIAPNLQGVGPATVMFWVTTGRMPAADTYQVQANSKPSRLSYTQALEVAAYINSLDPAVPFIPHVTLKGANVAAGQDLYALNCAACHTITGAGDALAANTYAPSLRNPTPQQVAEAIRTGPANMPRFTGNLTDSQVRDIVAYVTQNIQHPTNPGGAGLGGVGPVAEGFVALALGVGLLMLICFWIGERS